MSRSAQRSVLPDYGSEGWGFESCRARSDSRRWPLHAALHPSLVEISEALVLAEKAGVDRAAAYEVFANSAVAAPFVLYKQEAFVKPDETPVAFSLDLVAKDLDLILDLARQVEARMDQGEVNRAVVERALRAGLAERDLSAIAVLLRDLT